MIESDISHEAWLAEFKQRAVERDLAWLVSKAPSAHWAAYDQGLTPDEELSALADMSEWRGCGCGGGG